MHRLLLILTALAVLVLAACDGGVTDTATTPTPGPGTQTPDPTPTTPAATPTPDDEGTEAPTEQPTPEPTDTAETEDHLVAIDADGRVVVLDAESGEEVRVLLSDVLVGDPASVELTVTPDGEEVYVVLPPTDPIEEESRIVRLPVDGGEPEDVAEGTVPAISPDGGTLAYVDPEERDDVPAGHPEPVLVLRDLDSGEERRLTRDQPFTFVPDLEWTADGSQVLFTAGEIHTGLYAVDRDAEDLDAARRLGPELDEEETGTASWGPFAPIGEGRLAVVERCCGVPAEERFHLVAVDLEGGPVEDAGLPEGRLEVSHLAADADGRLLLVVRGGPEGGELLRWDGEDEPQPVADGIVAADW